MLGSGVAAFEDFEKGQYVKATLQAGLAATEAIGLGALKKLVTTGAQVGLKQGAKGFTQQGARGVVGRDVTETIKGGSKLLQQAMPNPDAFAKSAEAAWKQGAQGTLSNAGRALQKHAGRAGSAFSGIKFSGKDSEPGCYEDH